MKTKLLILFIFAANNLFSQDCPKFKEKREKYEAEKVAFIIRKLNLSVEESQKFWPIYNEYQNKRDEIIIEMRKLHKTVFNNTDNISDKQAQEALAKMHELKLKVVKLENEYDEKYLNIIQAKKVLLLHRAEREFKRTLLKELKQKGKK